MDSRHSANIVTQPVAQRLKEAGWENRTEKAYRRMDTSHGPKWSIDTWIDDPCVPQGYWLPAPNVTEIRERLTKEDFIGYWDSTWPHGILIYHEWLYIVTADADALASIWIWVQIYERG